MENSDNKLISERREKLKELRKQGNPFKNHFRPKDFAQEITESLSCPSYCSVIS